MAKASGYDAATSLGVDKKDHLFGLMNKMDKMRMERRGCDLAIKVDGREIRVHRNVMMAGSDFFDAMFTHDMQEKESGVFEMKGISFRIFNKCVEFIYTGDISVVVGECEELLFAAGMLQLTSVCNSIAPFLESRLSASSFFATRRIANKFSLANLKKVCDDFALKNLDRIVKEKEFDALEKEYISFLITTKKSTGPEGEDSKMAIILQWIKADIENRQQYLLDLATLLDFRRISPGLVKHLSVKEQVCSESPQFKKMLVLASVTDSSVERKSPKVSLGSSQAKSLVVFDESSKILRAYNPNTKNWTQMQVLHQDMSDCNAYTAVVVNNFIYVLVSSKKAYRLNFTVKSSRWESVPDMKKDHLTLRAAICGDSIYVVGNQSMERYRTSASKWMEINCSGISNCNYCAFAAYDNCVYVIGGSKDGRSLADVNRYSPLASSWSSMTPMPSPSQCAVATVHNDKIYVAGGHHFSTLKNFLSFHPKADTWTQLSPMIKCRLNFGLCIVANRLYAVGRYRSGCSIEMYDFKKKKWNTVADEDDNMKIMAPATVAIEFPES